MKSPETLLDDIRRRLERTWAPDLTGTTNSWPHRFPLGATTRTKLQVDWRTTYQPLISRWRTWAREHPVTLHNEPKRVYTTTQDVPTHIEVADLDTAAVLVGDPWPSRLANARTRLARIAARFPTTFDRTRLIRATDRYSDVDFGLLLTVATWFKDNGAPGCTPRQVPIPGIHGKWLDTHQPEILALSGLEDLGLLPRHPPRIHFTYLDPTYLGAGARRHDSATVGDSYMPPYRPTVVVISENKDTAIHFPPVAGGIAIEGEGFGGKTAAAFSWLTSARHLYYWGDIDTHGYEILNGWREDGVPVKSILMDSATYDAYEPYGTDTDRHGNLLKPSNAKPLPHLTTEERHMYQRLVALELPGHRRVEQERIPLRVALDALLPRTA